MLIETILTNYAFLSLATALIMFGYFATSGVAGYLRNKHKIEAPKMTGHPAFERATRVQMNNIENIIFFLPMVWLFGFYVSSFWAGVLAMVWLVGRIIYSVSYYKDAKLRVRGAPLYLPAMLIVTIGVFIGVIRTLIS